jgi:UDP-GlcNAc:undecaprenyl-phosphate GlcNAc-1-phosphate transferase
VNIQIFAYLTTFLFVVLLTDFLRRQALQAGLVDRPDARKRHVGAIPPVGGEAIFFGCLLCALAIGVPPEQVQALFTVGALVMVLGALDDYQSFPPQARLLAQAAIAVMMAVFGGATIDSAGALAPGGRPLELGAWSLPITVVATVGVLNAFNLIDGMDGLSGSLALVALLGLAVLDGVAGHGALLPLMLVLISGVAAFLALNMRSPWRWRASVFLGDAGSTFVGFTLSWLIIRLSQGGDPALSPVVGLWLLAVPLYDTGYLVCRRIARGRSPMAADRQHLHHFFLRAGFSVNQTLAIMVPAAVLLATLGVGGVLAGIGDRWLLAGFAAGFAVYCAGMTRAWKSHPRIRRRVIRRLRGSTVMPVVARSRANLHRDWPEQPFAS